MMLATSSARERSHAGEHASEKRSLASILRTHGPLSLAEAVDIALDVCDELAVAHTNGVVHGDLGLHRVRMFWPRAPKQRVDIFALDEDDSAAFAFRASAIAILVAPEQRTGRIAGPLADVWAVGAILHWMIAGRPPGSALGEDALAGAPRQLVTTITACLADDPSKRPQTVDEVAQGIASFASSPPDRFETLARRRVAPGNNMRVHADRGDVGRVLGRLDDLALDRELFAASDSLTQGSVARSVAERIMSPTQRSTAGSAIIPKPAPEALSVRPPPPVGGPPVAARVARSSVSETVEKTVPMVLPEAVAPPGSLGPVSTVRETAPRAAWASLRTTVPSRRTLLVTISAAVAVTFGIAVGMTFVGRPASHPAPAAGQASATTAAAPVPVAPVASTVAALPVARTMPAPTVPVVTPESLPDARIATPHSLPNARPVMTAAPAPSPAAPRTVPTSITPTNRDESPSDDDDDAP